MAQVTISFPDNRLALFQYLAEQLDFSKIEKVESASNTSIPHQKLWDHFALMMLAAGNKVYFPVDPEKVGRIIDEVLAWPAEENWLDRIKKEPGKMGGKANIRGYRFRAIDVLDYLSGGDTVETLMEGFDFLTKEDIAAAIRYVYRGLP